MQLAVEPARGQPVTASFDSRLFEPVALCYSGNFAKDWRGEVMQEKPPGSHYGLVLQQIRLLDEATRRKYAK